MPIKTSLVIKDFSTLFDAAEIALHRFVDTPFFRGQITTGGEKKRWKLLPKIFRNLSEDDASVRRYSRKHETNLFLGFCLGAASRHPSVPDVGDYARWLSLMQHYGLPTRLLDWTGSILVAAFFALREEAAPDEEPPVIWALSPRQLNYAQGAPRGVRFFRTDDVYMSPALTAIMNGGAIKEDRILAVMGEEIDQQMMLQQSCFTFHESQKPLEEFRGPKETINGEDILMKFEFSPDPAIRRQLQGRLASAGIRGSTLFPDLAHLASDLEQKFAP